MRWLALTVAMLTASALLVGGIYFRDRSTADSAPPQRPIAEREAQTMLKALGGGHCSHGCGVELVRRSGPNQWVARFHLPSVTECYEIDLGAFAWTSKGLTGAWRQNCLPPRRG